MTNTVLERLRFLLLVAFLILVGPFGPLAYWVATGRELYGDDEDGW